MKTSSVEKIECVFSILVVFDLARPAKLPLFFFKKLKRLPQVLGCLFSSLVHSFSLSYNLPSFWTREFRYSTFPSFFCWSSTLLLSSPHSNLPLVLLLTDYLHPIIFLTIYIHQLFSWPSSFTSLFFLTSISLFLWPSTFTALYSWHSTFTSFFYWPSTSNSLFSWL